MFMLPLMVNKDV